MSGRGSVRGGIAQWHFGLDLASDHRGPDGPDHAVVARAHTTRKPRVLPVPRAVLAPANKLDAAERARILEVVNSPDFVDLPPIQI